jgi:hypothetical protein
MPRAVLTGEAVDLLAGLSRGAGTERLYRPRPGMMISIETAPQPSAEGPAMLTIGVEWDSSSSSAKEISGLLWLKLQTGFRNVRIDGRPVESPKDLQALLVLFPAAEI